MSKPVYCRECKSRDSWERNPKKDIVGAETGKVMFEAWVCKVCGHKTIYPVGGVGNEPKQG